MRPRFLSLLLISAIVGSLLLIASPQLFAQTTDGGSGQPDQAVLTPALIAPPANPGLLAENSTYLSPPTEAAHPFTHMLVRREAAVPEGAGLALFARVSADGVSWGEWIELIDNDESDPFDFSVAHYNDMLIAGYAKNLPRLGLRSYMPDYNDIKAKRVAAAADPRPKVAAGPK